MRVYGAKKGNDKQYTATREEEALGPKLQALKRKVLSGSRERPVDMAGISKRTISGNSTESGFLWGKTGLIERGGAQGKEAFSTPITSTTGGILQILRKKNVKT